MGNVERAFTVMVQQGRGMTSQLKGPGFKEKERGEDRRCVQIVRLEITRLPLSHKAAAAVHSSLTPKAKRLVHHVQEHLMLRSLMETPKLRCIVSARFLY